MKIDWRVLWWRMRIACAETSHSFISYSKMDKNHFFFLIKFSGAQCAYNHARAFIMQGNRFPGERRYLVRTRSLGYFFMSTWSLITFWKNQCFEINILNALILAKIASQHKKHFLLSILSTAAHHGGACAGAHAESTHVPRSYSQSDKMQVLLM